MLDCLLLLGFGEGEHVPVLVEDVGALLELFEDTRGVYLAVEGEALGGSSEEVWVKKGLLWRLMSLAGRRGGGEIY